MTETQSQMMQRLAANTRVGYSFDQEFYTSDAVFKADMDSIISRKWLLAGHISRIPNKGDYFLFRVGAEQIIVIRENADKHSRLLQRVPPSRIDHLPSRKRQCAAACVSLPCMDLRSRWQAALRPADAGGF